MWISIRGGCICASPYLATATHCRCTRACAEISFQERKGYVDRIREHLNRKSVRVTKYESRYGDQTATLFAGPVARFRIAC